MSDGWSSEGRPHGGQPSAEGRVRAVPGAVGGETQALRGQRHQEVRPCG